MFLRSNLLSMILFISEQHTVVCPAAWGTGHGTCAVDDEYDYDSDCDTPASDCDEDEGPSGFWQLTRKAGRGGERPGLDCGCEICAVSSKYCDDNILRFGFFNANGTGNSMHTPSCCAVGRDARVWAAARWPRPTISRDSIMIAIRIRTVACILNSLWKSDFPGRQRGHMQTLITKTYEF